MVDIRPFKGIIYNPKHFQDLSNVLSPPYDVISTTQREQLLNQSSYNIVRIILGQTHGSSIDQDFYPFARKYWKDWRNQNILSRVKKPGMWILKEHFSGSEGQNYLREGVIALIKVEPYSSDSIMGHEVTHKNPKEDRLRLMENTQANLSPIFFIYDDSQKTGFYFIHNFIPSYTISSETNFNGHVLIESSYINDFMWMSTFSNYMKNVPVLIADGHHRYETALKFHQMYQENSSLETRFTLGYFVSSRSPGLVIYPTHRGIHSLPYFDPEGFFSKCQLYFDILDKGDSLVTKASSLPYIRMKIPDSQLITLRIKKEIFKRMKQKLTPSELALVDAVILQELILKNILRFSEKDIYNQISIQYYHTQEDCLDDLKQDKIQIAFLLSPLSVDLLFTITKKGGIIPPKTTYFYPKCPVGIVMNTLEKD